jgi:pimeloyl-ACP methyl ester carboxylesterase
MDSVEFESRKKFVDTPSGRIAYAESGEGPVALFIHGLLVNSFIWRHQLRELGDLRRCIAIDLMGQGATEISPAQDVSSAAQAAMLAELLDALGVDKVDVIGTTAAARSAQLLPLSIRKDSQPHPHRLRHHDNWPPQLTGFVEMRPR